MSQSVCVCPTCGQTHETRTVAAKGENVNLRIDRDRQLYVVSGHGRTMEFASEAAAKRELKQRVGASNWNPRWD